MRLALQLIANLRSPGRQTSHRAISRAKTYRKKIRSSQFESIRDKQVSSSLPFLYFDNAIQIIANYCAKDVWRKGEDLRTMASHPNWAADVKSSPRSAWRAHQTVDTGVVQISGTNRPQAQVAPSLSNWTSTGALPAINSTSSNRAGRSAQSSGSFLRN